MYDSRTGILTERELALGCYLGIAEEGECHILVVGTCLWVAEYLCHLLVVRTAQEEADVAECGIGHLGQSLWSDLEDRCTFEFAD